MVQRKGSTRRGFGSTRKLPSGRFQARYKHNETDYKAPCTFATKLDAEGWLASERRLMDLGQWEPPEVRAEQARRASERNALTFGDYFEQFLSSSNRSSGTRETYRSIYRNGIMQRLGAMALAEISRTDVAEWFAWLQKTYPERKNRNAESYTLVASVFNAAVDDELVTASPCKVRKAGKKPEAVQKELLTVEQLTGIVEVLPSHYRLAVLVASACALRIGEWSELRRKDVHLTSDGKGETVGARLYVSRQVTEDREASTKVVGQTKNRRTRFIPVPNGLLESLLEHIDGMESEQLLFPNADGEWTDRRRFNKAFKRAAESVGRGDVSSHDLRHFGGTAFTQSGATLAEAMARLGHATTGAALRYQHATEQRARELADSMALPAFGNVVNLNERRAKGA